LATILSIAKALKQAKYDQYKTVVLVDGLSKKKQKFVSSQLHKLKIKTEKVRGVRKDENDALIRLADAIAGFIRRVVENDNKMIYLYKKVVNKKIIEV